MVGTKTKSKKALFDKCCERPNMQVAITISYAMPSLFGKIVGFNTFKFLPYFNFYSSDLDCGLEKIK